MSNDDEVYVQFHYDGLDYRFCGEDQVGNDGRTKPGYILTYVGNVNGRIAPSQASGKAWDIAEEMVLAHRRGPYSALFELEWLYRGVSAPKWIGGGIG